MMGFITQLLGREVRRQMRIEVNWQADVKMPQTALSARFLTRDISLKGVRLVGDTPEAFQDVLAGDGWADIRFSVPGNQESLAVKGQLKWGMNDGGAFLTGWRFARLPRRTRKLLRPYIDGAHA